MFSKISLVFAIWGVSKDTVFALSSVLLKRQCLRLRQLGTEELALKATSERARYHAKKSARIKTVARLRLDTD